jgi:7,8-dihydro-6-hydroxymethylpterin-pyrophosphokinase
MLGEDGTIRVDTDELTVPHPEINNRPFVQRLLAQLRS